MLSFIGILGAAMALLPFTLKLVLGELVFAGHFERKSRFPLRLLLSLCLQLGISVALMLLLRGVSQWWITNTLYYFVLFVLSALCLPLLFAEPLGRLFPCAVGGYMAEHICAQLFVLLCYPVYQGLHSGSPSLGSILISLLIQLGIFLAVSWLIWFFFARKAASGENTPALEGQLHFLSAVTLLVVLVLSSVRDQYAEESVHLMVITRLFSIFCCVFLLYIRYVLAEKGRLEAEGAELRRMAAMERKAFEQSKENIELINIKCHDLRHRIDLWEKSSAPAEEGELREIRRMIQIYDAGVRTGNVVLDTLLTERSLYCEKEGIRLSCMADGGKLSFLSTGDLCSLFGNAIENAIEAASRVPDPENRMISLQVRESRGMLVITAENSYAGRVDLAEGLPGSSKANKENHGLGLKSIRNAAEKYGGQMSIRADEADGIFSLTVMIPLPEGA